MYNHISISKLISRWITAAMLLGVLLITSSTPHAAEPRTIVASAGGVHVCMRPVGGSTGEVGIEGVLWKCDDDDGVLWRVRQWKTEPVVWFINDKSCTDKNRDGTCKCLTREGEGVLLRECNFATDGSTDHS